MDTDSKVAKLLSLALSSGETPEAVCRDCPELLDKVRHRLAAHRRVQSQIEAWFPPAPRGIPGDDPGVGPNVRSGIARPPGASGRTPELPGYEIESLLGQGGMGRVYRARHLRLNRPVAIKVLVDGAHAELHKLERFLREAEAVACLQHPNIVQVYDIGEFSGQSYFTMELIEGGSLAQKLHGAPQPARYAAGLVATLALAVHAAHDRGVLHRDLKPSNVLLAADGTPKISDFGLARRVQLDGDDLTLAGAPIGTPSYMSPEQAEGRMHAIGPATDIYSLGAILYEMLTGRPPFRGESPADTLLHVINDPPVHPSRLNPKVPRHVETICLKCLDKDPRRRYASAQALADDLNRFLRGEPIAARRATALERTWMWVRRRPIAAALYAALALVILLGLTLAAGSVRAGQRRAATESAVREDLQKLADVQRSSRWEESKAMLAHARGLLTSRTFDFSPDLRAAVDRAATNLELAQRLESIRLHRVPLLGRVPDDDTADREYEASFLGAGLMVGMDDQTSAAMAIMESGMTQPLVAALDDWAVATQDERRRAWCLGVARLADGDSTNWRERLRDPRVWADRAALVDAIESAPLDTVSLPLIVAAAERLQDIGGGADAIRFLSLVNLRRPDDFGVNIRLGFALIHQGRSVEAVGHYQAAFALNPRGDVCDSLGSALKAAGQHDAALACFEEAVHLDPAYAPAHLNLGVALRRKGRADQSLGCFRRAVEADPTFAEAHNILADALTARGDTAGAIEHYEQALRLDPTLPEPHDKLGLLFADQGREDEALHHLREAVRIDPEGGHRHASLGQALLAQGKLDEAEIALLRALELFPVSDSRRAQVQRNLTECRNRLPR